MRIAGFNCEGSIEPACVDEELKLYEKDNMCKYCEKLADVVSDENVKGNGGIVMNKGCSCEVMGKSRPNETSEDECVGEIKNELNELEEKVEVYGVQLEKLQCKLETVLSKSKPKEQDERNEAERHTELGDRIFLVHYNLDKQIDFLKDLISRIEL